MEWVMLFLFAQFPIDLIISTPNSPPSYWNLFWRCLPTSELLSTFHLLEFVFPRLSWTLASLASSAPQTHAAALILAYPLLVSYSAFLSHTFCVSSHPTHLNWHFTFTEILGKGELKVNFTRQCTFENVSLLCSHLMDTWVSHRIEGAVHLQVWRPLLRCLLAPGVNLEKSAVWLTDPFCDLSFPLSRRFYVLFCFLNSQGSEYFYLFDWNIQWFLAA